jgi:hypothetical protein
MLSDVVLRLLGPEACDDADERAAEPKLVAALLQQLAKRGTGAAWLLLADVATRRSTLPLLFDSHWLRLALREVGAMTQRALSGGNDENDDMLDAARDVLLRVAPHVNAALAPALFELLLQLMCALSARAARSSHLRAPAERRRWFSLAGKPSSDAVAVGGTASQAACDDELFAKLIRRIPRDAPLALAAIDEALHVGGPRQFVCGVCVRYRTGCSKSVRRFSYESGVGGVCSRAIARRSGGQCSSSRFASGIKPRMYISFSLKATDDWCS